MKNTLFVALSTLLLLCLSACEKDKIVDPAPAPSNNQIDLTIHSSISSVRYLQAFLQESAPPPLYHQIN